MKKIVRLTESDLVRLVKRIISEGERYGSFGDEKWVDMDTDQYSDDDMNDDDFDTEDFDDYESFHEKHPKRRDLSGVVSDTVSYLASYQQKKVLFITTSTRYPFNTGYDKGGVEDELPKSTELALFIKDSIPNKSSWIDIPQLKIVPCEGNVSHKTGNSCGVMDSALKDKKKNPSGNHRCWASVNDKSDQLWKVSDEIFNADIILFFGSIRWGQANSFYQKLIERLCWIENRWASLGEENIIKGKDSGFIFVGQNWNGSNVVKTEKQVLKFYGFNTPDELFWNWQFTHNVNDESLSSYKKAILVFENLFDIVMKKFIEKYKKLSEHFK
jgi:hypothetical protein